MSLIDRDFSFREPEHHQRKSPLLRWSLIFILCTLVGIVITNIDILRLFKTNNANNIVNLPLNKQSTVIDQELIQDVKSTQTTLDLPKEKRITPPLANTSAATQNNRQSFNLSLPNKSAENKAATNSKRTSVSIKLTQKTTRPATLYENEKSTSSRFTSTSSLPEITLTKKTAVQAAAAIILDTSPQNWEDYKVRSGDSLARLFDRAGIPARDLNELMKSGDAVKQLRKIYPKDIIELSTDSSGALDGLRYDIDYQTYLLVERRNGRLLAKIEKHDIDTRTNHASATIESSLFLAAQKAGISQNIIMELASIFGWDIDFVLDIRKGDKFTVVYEELFRNGEKISDGNILTAEFTNKKKIYKAVRYTNPETNQAEYYTADGKSMRKAFLRTPVNFSRISSRFTLKRYHPVLHKFRSHKGVDYAAKRGTPIHAAGDGKVIFKGKKGGYGRVVIIQHGSKYTTLYAHLKTYNKKLRKGSKVKQGQTIAYVGSSGLATGPHLHYEFRVNGVHRNPLTVKLPEAKPVPRRYLADFELNTKPLLAQLDAILRSQQVALIDSDNRNRLD